MLGLLGASVGLERVPQVIGFAPAGTESAGLDAVQAGPMLPRGYRYQDVMFHANPRQGTTFARTGSAAHESLLKAPVPADHARRIGAMRSRTMAPAVVGTSGRETLLSAHPGLAASVPATAKTVSRVQAVAMTQTAASRDGGAGWVVVTAWQGADGSRMILTTVATTAGQGAWVARQEDARAADGRAAVQTYGGAQLRKEVQPEEDRPRYAAVPVRDGWLVFQL
jgi:hypothetical protein